MDTGGQGSHLTEEGGLAGCVIPGDSRGSCKALTGLKDSSISHDRGKTAGVGGVWRGHGGLSVSTKAFLENGLTPQEREIPEISLPVYGKDGTLLTSTDKMIRWWKEHFEELLNVTNPSSIVEAELEDDGGSTLISLGEVTEVVKHLHSGKAPGVDEIRPEMLEALGVEGLSWLTCLINIMAAKISRHKR